MVRVYASTHIGWSCSLRNGCGNLAPRRIRRTSTNIYGQLLIIGKILWLRRARIATPNYHEAAGLLPSRINGQVRQCSRSRKSRSSSTYVLMYACTWSFCVCRWNVVRDARLFFPLPVFPSSLPTCGKCRENMRSDACSR